MPKNKRSPAIQAEWFVACQQVTKAGDKLSGRKVRKARGTGSVTEATIYAKGFRKAFPKEVN